MTNVMPSEEAIFAAAAAILKGQLVVMPTETVYGLAGDALNPDAISKIFLAKGRPNWNPLIVHVDHLSNVHEIADTSHPGIAQLAAAFWPGPLTLVLPKKDCVPDIVTAGLSTVAVRIPAHRVALALMATCNRPLAAPSANMFTELSPTCIENVAPAIRDQVAVLLDGGPCTVGIESTVIDLTERSPRILRQGMISQASIEEVVSCKLVNIEPVAVKSPGLHPRHYAPRTPVRIVHSLGDQAGLGFGPQRHAQQIQMPSDPVAYARALYAALAALDRLELSEIAIESVPDDEAWCPIRDRLSRASYTDGK